MTNIKSQPMRRCVGCMESKPKKELIKLVGYQGKLSLDKTGRANGRGVYICKNLECMELAEKKKAIQRSLKMEISKEDLQKVFSELRDFLEESNEK